MVSKRLLKHLSPQDLYNIKTSIAVLFLPPNIKDIFLSDMYRNRLNEHLMLMTVVNYSLRTDIQDRESITHALETSTKIILDEYIIEKTKQYFMKNMDNHLDYPELLI